MMILNSRLFMATCWMSALLLQGADARKNRKSSSKAPKADSSKSTSDKSSKGTKKSKSSKSGGKKGAAPVISPTMSPVESSGSAPPTKSPVESGSTAPPVETLSPTKNMGLMPVAPAPLPPPTVPVTPTPLPPPTIPVTPAPAPIPAVPATPAPPPLPTIPVTPAPIPLPTIPVTPAPVPSPSGAVVYLNNTAAFEAVSGGPFLTSQCEDFDDYNPAIDTLGVVDGFEECQSPLSSTNKCPFNANSVRPDEGDGYESLLPGFSIAFQTDIYYIITQADALTGLTDPIVAIAGNGDFPDYPIVSFSVPVRSVLVKLYYEDASAPPAGSTAATLVVYGAGDAVLATRLLPPVGTASTLEIGIVATQNIVRFQINDEGGEAFYQLCFRA